jgi:hypothetical protein
MQQLAYAYMSISSKPIEWNFIKKAMARCVHFVRALSSWQESWYIFRLSTDASTRAKRFLRERDDAHRAKSAPTPLSTLPQTKQNERALQIGSVKARTHMYLGSGWCNARLTRHAVYLSRSERAARNLALRSAIISFVCRHRSRSDANYNRPPAGLHHSMFASERDKQNKVKNLTTREQRALQFRTQRIRQIATRSENSLTADRRQTNSWAEFSCLRRVQKQRIFDWCRSECAPRFSRCVPLKRHASNCREEQNISCVASSTIINFARQELERHVLPRIRSRRVSWCIL